MKMDSDKGVLDLDILDSIMIDWSKVEVDTPILVKDCAEDPWFRRYFARYEDGTVYAFNAGCTSWSAYDWEFDVTAWRFAKLAEKEGE